MKISNIKERYAVGHKFDMVDFVANGRRSSTGGRPCFACHALHNEIAYGFFNPNTFVVSYGIDAVIPVNDMEEWSEGCLAMYLKESMGSHFVSLACVFEDDGSWTSRLLLQSLSTVGNSATCVESIFMAVKMAGRHHGDLSVIVEDMVRFFGHDTRRV